MRKRILSIITMLIFTFLLLPTTALADDSQPTTLTADVLRQNSNKLSSGNYKLEGNLDITNQININGKVTLDLNGYVLRQTGRDQYVIATAASGDEFTLVDSSNSKVHYFTVEENDLWKYTGDTQPTSGDYRTITGGVITGGTENSVCGGVWVSINTIFNMEGGNIVGCNVLDNGGGVCNRGTFNMKGGSIKGCVVNSYDANGGGVFNQGTMNIGGDPAKTVTITDNKHYVDGEGKKTENVYLDSGATINVVGGMSSDSRIGISSQKKDFGTTVVTGVNNITNPLTIFSSDDDTVLEVVGNDIKLSHEHQWGPYVVGNGTETSSCQTVVNGTPCSATRSRLFAMPADTPIYTISGQAKISGGGNVDGANVYLMQGNRQWASGVTGANGNFLLSGVPSGVYNLVIKKNALTYTGIVKVESSDKDMGTVSVGAASSILKIDNDDANNPLLVVVEGLGTLAASLGSKIEMTVGRGDSNANLQTAIGANGHTLKSIFKFDIKNLNTPTLITDTGALLNIYIELPADLQGKSASEFVVYREHDYSTGGSGGSSTGGGSIGGGGSTADGTGGSGGGSTGGGGSFGGEVIPTAASPFSLRFSRAASEVRVDTLTSTPNDYGEYIEIIGNYLVIHARLFSDYAIAYAPASTPTPSPGGTSSVKRYTIEATAQANGSISPDGSVKVRKGRDKTFTITPDAGYEIARVLVDGDNVGTVDTYTFENVRKNHTIEAFFAATGDEIGGTDEPEGLIGYLPNGLNHTDHIAYVHGYEDGTVRPESPITRAETAMMLYQLLTEERLAEIRTTKHSFSDVDADDWYCEAVATMANGGYIMGYEDGTFGGNRPITRAEFVAILVRFIGAENVVCNFVDVPDNHWAYRYIATATEAGWIAGFEDGTFRPDQSITRAEVMAIINRALNRGVDAESELLNFKPCPDNFANRWYYYEVIEATNGHDYTGHRPSEDWTKLF